MVYYDIDPLIRVKPYKLLTPPRIVCVSQFTSDAIDDFRAEVDAALVTGQPVIPIVINSYGGDIYGLFAMVDIIEAARAGARIATIVEGKAMSAGAALASCGDDGLRFIAPNATIMIHDGWEDGASGKTHDMAANADELRRLTTRVYDTISTNCGKPKGHFAKLVHARNHADWFITPKEALKHKLANHIGVPQLGVRVTVDWAFSLATQKGSKR